MGAYFPCMNVFLERKVRKADEITAQEVEWQAYFIFSFNPTGLLSGPTQMTT